MREPLRPVKALIKVLAACGVMLAGVEAADRLFWFGLGWSQRAAKAGTFDIYVVGESTAVGEPYGRKLAPAALAAEQFGGRIGGREIRIIALAESGQSIYPQAVALERRLQGRGRGAPGVVLIYSGHNDSGEAPSELPYYEPLRRVLTRRSALLRDLWFLLEKRFVSLRVRDIESWEYHLRRVIELSRSRGLIPILATAPSNTTDIDPGLRMEDVEEGELAELRKVRDRGLSLEARRHYREAVAQYQMAAIAARPLVRRYLNYRTARCYEALKRYAQAKPLYQEVADSGSSGNFGRASRGQNEKLRALAARYAVPLADALTAFEAASPHGLLGDSLFSDGHHPNIEGYRLLADAYAARIAVAFGEAGRRPIADVADLLRRTSLSREERADALNASGRWLFSVASWQVFPQQRLAMARRRFAEARKADDENLSAWIGLQMTDLAERSDLLRSQEGLDWLDRHDLFYGRGIKLTCAQLREISLRFDGAARGEELHRRCLAEFERVGSKPPLPSSVRGRKPRGSGDHGPSAVLRLYRRFGGSAAAAWLVARLPAVRRDPVMLLELAQISLEQGAKGRAKRFISRARGLALEPEERGRMAILYQAMGEYAEELEILDALLREEPGDARWLSDRGVARFLAGRKEEAAADWLSAIKQDPRFLPAYQSLGVYYTASGRERDALALYDAALARGGALHEDARNSMRAARAKLLKQERR